MPRIESEYIKEEIGAVALIDMIMSFVREHRAPIENVIIQFESHGRYDQEYGVARIVNPETEEEIRAQQEAYKRAEAYRDTVIASREQEQDAIRRGRALPIDFEKKRLADEANKRARKARQDYEVARRNERAARQSASPQDSPVAKVNKLPIIKLDNFEEPYYVTFDPATKRNGNDKFNNYGHMTVIREAITGVDHPDSGYLVGEKIYIERFILTTGHKIVKIGETDEILLPKRYY